MKTFSIIISTVLVVFLIYAVLFQLSQGSEETTIPCQNPKLLVLLPFFNQG